MFMKMNYIGGGEGSTNFIESPFTKSKTFVLYLEPLLNTYYKSYQNVITLNCLPSGPLADMVVQIDMPKLSPFQSAAAYASPFYNGSNCRWVLLRYRKRLLEVSGLVFLKTRTLSWVRMIFPPFSDI